MEFKYTINDLIDLDEHDLRSIVNKMNNGDSITFAISTVLDDRKGYRDARYISNYDIAQLIEDDVRKYIEENLDDDNITFEQLNYLISKYDKKVITAEIDNDTKLDISFSCGNISYIDISMYNSKRELVHYIIKIRPNIDITKNDVTCITYNRYDRSYNIIERSDADSDTINLSDTIYDSNVLKCIESVIIDKLIELFKKG